MFLLGLAIILFSFGFLMTFGVGNLINFIDLPSLIAIVAPLVAVLTATQSFKVFFLGLRVAIFSKTEISEEMRRRATSLFRLLSKTTAMAAAISILICSVSILAMLDFSDVAVALKFARNVAVIFIAPLYALLLIIAIFEPVVFILKKHCDTKR